MGQRSTAQALAAVGLLLGVLLAGCSAPHHSLAALTEHQDAYDGQAVSTSGTVRRFEDPSGPYFVLEDEDGNRVEVTPANDVSGYVGQTVSVTGRFRVDPQLGRLITVETVSASGP